MPQGCIYHHTHAVALYWKEAVHGTLPYISHLRWPRRPSSSLTEEIEREVVLPHQLWTNLGVEGARTITLCQRKLVVYARPDVSLAYTENVTTVTAHLQPAFALQLGLRYKVQVGYRFSTGPRPKRNQRQEGTHPSWPRRLRVRTRSITGRYFFFFFFFFFFFRGHMWAHNNHAQSIINIMMMMTINE